MIGDNGGQLVSKFNGLIAAIGSQFIYTIESYKLQSDPDDTLAFQRCIADMPESTAFGAGGGTILLGGKNYTISSTIVIEKSFQMIGVGADSGTSISLAENSNCNMFEIGKRNSSDPMSVTMEGIRIQMLGTQADGFSNIVCYNYIRHSHFKDLFLIYATGPNFEMKVDAEGGTAGRNNYFYGCAFEYGKGFSVKITHSYNLNINSCYFGFGVAGQASYGLYVSMSSDRFILANSWFLQDSRAGNLYLTGVVSGHVVNNKFNGAENHNTGSAHVYIGTCSNINIGGNVFSAGYDYGIRVENSVDKIRIYDNIIGAAANRPFYIADKTKVECHNNSSAAGLQSNNGSASILEGQSYIEVTHGILSTPDNVIATPQGNEAIWVDTIGTTVFRINRVGTTGVLVCNWMASVKTY
jgi:hypothetical protein